MIGRTLSHYRIAEKIGQGGMGEVYRAVDTSLGREVAIKLLPDAFVSDPERLARFHREARVLASLSHSGIAVIHALEEAEGMHLLVMELVPGPTLADRIASGPLPLNEALGIGAQIAEALESAHAKGIIHRDLKPANVKVAPDGKVKVLDFGLAKALADPDRSADLSLSPTVTSANTGTGVILGTVSYMSPEQARGQELDQRTDVFSFGCLLYEMITGRRAFPGGTISDTLAALLKSEPDLEALPPGTPPGIRRLLRRCLAKDAAHRLRHVGDAQLEIEEALEGAETDTGTAPAGDAARPRHRGLTVAAVVGAALVGAVAAWLFLPATSTVPAAPVLLSADRLTHDPGISEWPTWSPDGSLLAFASNRDGNLEVYVRQVAGGQEVDISDDPGQDFQPAFSPDGKSIAFISTRSSATGMIKIGSQFGFEFRTYGGDLWLAPALGGRAQRLAERANMPAWSPDGTRIAYISGPENHRSIKQVGVDGSEAPALLPADRSRWEIVRIQYTPDGRSLTFEATDSTIWILPVSGGEPRFLLDGTSHTWGPKGDRLFTLTRAPLGGTRIGMVPFDPATGTAGKLVTIGVMTGILNHLAISADGRHLAVSEMEGSMNLTMLRLNAAGDGPAGDEVTLSHGQVIDRYPAVSPDGTLVAYSSNRLGPEEIWIRNLETGHADRLDLPGKDIGVNTPLWFPDGRSLIVTRFYPNGTRSLWRVALDGSDAREVVAPLPGLEGGYVLPGGKTISYTYVVDGQERPFLMDLATEKSRPDFDSPGDVFSVLRSPDGRWIVFWSNASGSIQLWRLPTAGGKPERLTTGEDRIRHASISPDSRWVYFQPNHQNIYRIPITGGKVEQITHFDPSGLFIEEPKLSPDGKVLVYCRSHGGSSLWLLTLGAGGTGD